MPSANPAGDWKLLEAHFAAYLAGDAEAARPLFAGITQALKGYFRARMGIGQDADDLLQTTLLKIHFARDRYDPQKPLKTWVFTIASRSLIDHWRGISSEGEVLQSPSSTDEASELENVGSHELGPELKTLLHGDLNKALAGLKPIERSIVYLYGVEGMTMAEIAESLKLTEGATKLRAHRAYVEMRKMLES